MDIRDDRRYQLQMVDENGGNRVTMGSDFLTKAHLLAIYLQKPEDSPVDSSTFSNTGR